jgi:hypothetical protein
MLRKLVPQFTAASSYQLTRNEDADMQKIATLSNSRSHRSAQVSNWIVRGLFGIAAMTTVALIAWVIVNGPQIRAAIEAEKASQIEKENLSVCAVFGAGPQTDRFAECAATLKDVRANHEQRNAEPF